MKNLIKLIYCLIERDDLQKIIFAYAKYTTLEEKRALKMALDFNVRDGQNKVLKYMMNKTKYDIIATRRWQKIEEKIRKQTY